MLFEEAITHWRDKRGIGTALIPPLLNPRVMLLSILQRMYNRSPTIKVLIVVNSFSERREIIDFLTTQPDSDENNSEFKELLNNGYIKILTVNYISTSKDYVSPSLLVLYNLDSINSTLIDYLKRSLFKLVILTKLLADVNERVELYKVCPILDDFKTEEVAALRANSPVEEHQIGISITDDNDLKLLKYYNDYITTSLSIFGNFDVMQEIRRGNSDLNISAMEICTKLAYENGWNEHLDMNIELNRSIDELFNPNSLRDRVLLTYENIRKRSVFLSDYKSKLEEVYNIVKENQDKKILVISKRGEFANEITEYLNQSFPNEVCGNYHDKVDPIPAVLENGDPIYYKSGRQKGQRKYFGAQAQQKYFQDKFNSGKINVISTSCSPDSKLSIDVDIVIITSPQCMSMQEYIYRLDKLGFPSGKITLYTLFIKDTQEEKMLEDKIRGNNHKIVQNLQNSENNFEFSASC